MNRRAHDLSSRIRYIGLAFWLLLFSEDRYASYEIHRIVNLACPELEGVAYN